jgi:hypothetical protein
MSITFSTCFYIIKSKFDENIYSEWMTNLFSIVNHFNLVIYTNKKSFQIIQNINDKNNLIKNNSNIKIVIKSMKNFYNYQYKKYWIKNHKKNELLKNTSWKLNMLWSEKIWFVKKTIEKKYFDTEFYGWCDIGYFRNRYNDLHSNNLSNWGNNIEFLKKIHNNKRKICYACINNNDNYMKQFSQFINDKNDKGLPKQEIPVNQQSFAGGFFILHKDEIKWWSTTYDDKLKLYFKNNYLVKDDQFIIADCILSNLEHFSLFRENNLEFDNWFMFQRILL